GLDELALAHPARARDAQAAGELLQLCENHAVETGGTAASGLVGRGRRLGVVRPGGGCSEQIRACHAGSFPWTGAGENFDGRFGLMRDRRATAMRAARSVG